MFVLHFNAKPMMTAISRKKYQVCNPRPDAKALSDGALDRVAVGPIILVRNMEKQSAILRECVKEPLEALGLNATLVALVATLLRLWWRLND